LIYLEADEEMRCAVCGKRFASKTRCVNGHFVCNECHMAGLDAIISLCLSSDSKNPVEIIQAMMAQPFCHMHGPEHHVMVGAALLTAYQNAGGEIELEKALSEMMKRGKSVPGGACGFWGACGAGVSTGMFVSILSSSTPLAVEKCLTKNFHEELIPKAHHWLILHGRYTCTARNPKCESCGLNTICNYAKNHHS
jgi:hypothetical protein